MGGHKYLGGNSGIITCFVNGEGEVVGVLNAQGGPLTDNDYDEEVGERRIDEGAFIVSKNDCRWRLLNGRWVCVPW
jgi:hypothetical protein